MREKENRNNVSLLTIIEKFCSKCFVTHTAHHKTIQIKPKSVGVSLVRENVQKCIQRTCICVVANAHCVFLFDIKDFIHRIFSNSVIFVCCVHNTSIWLVWFSVSDTFSTYTLRFGWSFYLPWWFSFILFSNIWHFEHFLWYQPKH